MRKFDILKLSREDFRISFGIMGRLLSIGIPMGLQFSITAIGTIIVQGAVNVFGSVYIAGFSAAGKIQNIVFHCVWWHSGNGSTYVGREPGAGRMDRVQSGGQVHTGYDSGLERCYDSGHPFIRGYADPYIY